MTLIPAVLPSSLLAPAVFVACAESRPADVPAADATSRGPGRERRQLASGSHGSAHDVFELNRWRQHGVGPPVCDRRLAAAVLPSASGVSAGRAVAAWWRAVHRMMGS